MTDPHYEEYLYKTTNILKIFQEDLDYARKRLALTEIHIGRAVEKYKSNPIAMRRIESALADLDRNPPPSQTG